MFKERGLENRATTAIVQDNRTAFSGVTNSSGLKEVIMDDNKKPRPVDFGCDSRCIEEYVKCMETEEGASICKTRERNCFEECSL